MTWANNTGVTEFILLGFSGHLQLLLFVVFLAVYITTALGNILIIFLTSTDPALQIPMYFLLRNLSLVDICLALVILPKMLVNLLSEHKGISFLGCVMQMFFFLFLGGSECFLLAAMAYDRYVAICNPLRYTVIMKKGMCVQLTLFSWCSGVVVGTVQTTWVFSFPFCGPNKVDHFFCDSPPVLKLACADTYLFEIYAVTGTILIVLFPFMLIVVSYVCILRTILKIPSAQGRHKAFSTCTSHIVVVILFYGTAGLTYFQPKSSYSPELKKLLSLSYTVFTPMLNPIVYSLRNKEVRGATMPFHKWVNTL
uniref:Olfactory receptor n=1 Tax=Varanus komodoensis TaxID=61221 RepID=A0A8D2ITM4_VARKO